jgi:non-homologous end joining protein Ku
VSDALTPIKPERVAEELRKICDQRDTGQLDRDEYEHRFARMVSELRDRKIAGTRAESWPPFPAQAEGKVDAIADRLPGSLGHVKRTDGRRADGQ